ncbi:hypothetical protein [Frigoriglobus tundricola]|uniref:Uncharacterized protein n=1 Tax=Frigoriglobus tundricola TaxID=2774151 RepID=A0A6M5YIV1_9BACT|nr:hypothetical protein [Frigoriglobus tundricola]QJW93206.1 hypothetical protein FTUN_0711 [Frigoriglobus tundricola]
MTTVLQLKTDALATAATLSGFLWSWLLGPDLATLEQMENAFMALPTIVEALPPTVADTALMCYLRNRVKSSQELKESGNFATAAYQLREMHLKLTRLARETA